MERMNLLQMSVSGGILILAIAALRALTINKLPKNTFLALWGVALLRLLLPFSLPSALSAYSLIEHNAPAVQTIQRTPTAALFPAGSGQGIAVAPGTAGTTEAWPSISVWNIAWAVGAALCLLLFAVSYIRCCREFQTSVPVTNAFVEKWLAAHQGRRPIAIRQSGRLAAPLTYGVLRPVILMPKGTDWNDSRSLSYVLAHEEIHIRRFDAVTKLVLTAALCIHWFNPLVWFMYLLANRDMELSCDEAVVRRFGEENKSAYARMLIRMEETKSGLTPLCNCFSKSAIEERVTAIMKLRKTSFTALCAAAALVIGVTLVFATSAAEKAGLTPPENVRRLAFGQALWDVYQKGLLPDGQALDGYNMHELERAALNSFAIADLDGNGQEELLLLWQSGITAGMKGRVFGYDGEAVYEKLVAFPSLRFYDNGIVEEDWSHNQNLAGDFWPYFVHRYDAESGVYQCIGGVDAWNRRVREENAEGDIFPVHFPTDIDADGDGTVYFLLPADWDGYYWDVPMVDGAEYESWRGAYLDGARELNIPYQQLTEENIAALGYPKPDVRYPEPLG